MAEQGTKQVQYEERNVQVQPDGSTIQTTRTVYSDNSERIGELARSPDGAISGKVTEVSPDGSYRTSQGTKYPDGSSTVEQTTVSSDGEVVDYRRNERYPNDYSDAEDYPEGGDIDPNYPPDTTDSPSPNGDKPSKPSPDNSESEEEGFPDEEPPPEEELDGKEDSNGDDPGDCGKDCGSNDITFEEGLTAIGWGILYGLGALVLAIALAFAAPFLAALGAFGAFAAGLLTGAMYVLAALGVAVGLVAVWNLLSWGSLSRAAKLWTLETLAGLGIGLLGARWPSRIVERFPVRPPAKPVKPGNEPPVVEGQTKPTEPIKPPPNEKPGGKPSEEPSTGASRPSRTRPTGEIGGKPTEKRTDVKPNHKPEARQDEIRALTRENESADVLAKEGYKVEQNPDVPGTKNPDYKIEGEVFDCYAPRKETGVNGITSRIESKVNSGQADRIVLNLEDNNASLPALRESLSDVEGLKEVIIIKDGKVIPFFP